MQDVVLFGVGIVIGVMNAIAGGGMLLGFPILLAFGMSPLAANVTGNVVIGASTVSSVYGYRQYLRKISPRYLLLLIPCIIGAAIGALILRNTSSNEFQQIVPALVGLAVILFAFQPLLHFHLHRHIRSKRRTLRPLVIIAIALLPVAIYGGYFGAGFGFVMLAFLGFTKLHEIHQMNGLKNLAGACIAFTSLICLYSTHLINWHLGLVMGAGCVLGGYYGATLTQKVSSHTLRIVVIIIGVVTATYLALRSY
ncbi:MAG TPA: sulfite exporter TauE/SafE family protein [Candidatus Saccharimonadales bacterium]|nr:sulfite exporter TauE/SafE family protein [Candidatus Saccharimonadales bacterium]